MHPVLRRAEIVLRCNNPSGLIIMRDLLWQWQGGVVQKHVGERNGGESSCGLPEFIMKSGMYRSYKYVVYAKGPGATIRWYNVDRQRVNGEAESQKMWHLHFVPNSLLLLQPECITLMQLLLATL